MNQEDSSVLDLLRQAVEAAADGESGGQSGPGGTSMLALGVPDTLGQTGSAVVTSAVSGLAGLTGGTAGGPSWTNWVSRVNPIAGLIAGLFTGGGEAAAETPVATYLRPESLRMEAGFDGSSDPGITSVERQEGGQFRPSTASNGGAQVVVQVQAMDSRSFLDHTPEIAEAVKRALLESNGLRDVLGEY